MDEPSADFVLCGGPRSCWPARGKSTGYACPARDGLLSVSWPVGAFKIASGKAMFQRHTNIIRSIGVRRAGPGLP